MIERMTKKRWKERKRERASGGLKHEGRIDLKREKGDRE